jgi:hypothetical protein
VGGGGSRSDPGEGAPGQNEAEVDARDPTAPEVWKRRYAPEEVPDAPSASSRVRKNTLDEMTVRRTEVPIGGIANAAGAPTNASRNRPRKPTLDNKGPGTDREVPVQKTRPHKPSLDEMAGVEEVPSPKTRPHRPSLKETHGSDFIPLTEGERPRPRSIGGMPGSDAGKGKPRRRR